MNDTFYARLPPLDAFADLARPDRFVDVPADWWLVVADVQGSTQAIAAGRYRDVNLLGAAAIAAMRHALGSAEFPFVFGGDGATAAIPPWARPDAARHLASLRVLARERFDLHLRVGMVGVDELRRAGHPTRVARLRLAGTQHIALFRGSGVREAERWVKADPSRFDVPAAAAIDPPLQQLSCRWQPIASRQGVMVALIAQAIREDADEVYRRLLARLCGVLGGAIENACPVHPEQMRYRSPLAIVRSEQRLASGWLSPRVWARLLEIGVAALLFGLGLDRWFPRVRRYRQSLALHSDYRKFDDTLRLVVDCTPQQHRAIERVLQEAHAAGELVYGLHASPEALMTCLVQSVDDGEHLHFIDGSHGGYAMAAVQLKAMGAERVARSA